MLSSFLRNAITSQAGYVECGYAQLEPNHLAAQKNGEVYAQLPADENIKVLEQGQFVKYDYATGKVNFTGEGPWMLNFNEIKLHRDGQADCEFALIKDNYQARIYSPFDGNQRDGQSRFYNGYDAEGNTEITYGREYALTKDSSLDSSKTYYTFNGTEYTAVTEPSLSAISTYYEMTKAGVTFKYDDVTAAEDIYEPHYNVDPFHISGRRGPAYMPEGTTMVPRVFGTTVGDIYTTNCIGEETLVVGDKLYVGDKGILSKTKKNVADANGAVSGDMVWKVVKVYTVPDGQKGVKIQRIA